MLLRMRKLESALWSVVFKLLCRAGFKFNIKTLRRITTDISLVNNVVMGGNGQASLPGSKDLISF